MPQSRKPVRLLIEVLVIVTVAQAAVMWSLPTIAANFPARGQNLLSAVLLMLLAGPTIYWRCMAGLRQLNAPTGSGREAPRSSTVSSAVAMTAAAQALGLALTGVCVVWQLRSIAATAQEDFNRRAEQMERDVRRHFALPVYALNGLRGMFGPDGQLSREQFRAWVASRDLPAEFPGVSGLGFIERVEPDPAASGAAAQHAGGHPGFAAPAAGTAADLYLVKYLEPGASNQAAVGDDMGRDPVRREAAERALRSGLPSLSASTALLQDGHRSAGFLYFVPVYRGGDAAAVLAKPEQRPPMAIGLLYAPMVASEIMKGAIDVAGETVDIALFEGDAAPAGDPLFDSRRESGRGSAAAPREPAFESQRRLVVGGRTLTLRATSTPAFEAAIDRSSAALIATGGALVSFLMALAVWLLAVGRVRAQRRAQRMTADLARLARVVQHTSNSVVIADAQMRINWVNEGFTRITGYTLEEAAGRTPRELLAHPDADPATISTVLGAVADGRACRIEMLNRGKHGRSYWVDTELQPTRDEHGALLGFMEIGTDITERRALDEELRRSHGLMAGVIQNLPCGLSVVDEALKLVAHNGQFRELLDLPDRLFEAPDPTFDRFVRFSAERGDYGAGEVDAVVAGVVAQARLPVVQFFEREAVNGVPLDVRRAPLPGGGFVTTYTDVSARKQSEVMLKEALARAEQASVIKSQFLANMSHEIRTPMNAILGMLSLLQKTELTKRQRDYASKTEGAARSLLGLLNDILDFSKAEAGKMTLDPRVFRLDGLLRDLSVILSANLGAKTIDVLFDIDPTVPPCLVADDMRLLQVLINLGGNAIKFTAVGQVVLELRVLERTGSDVLLEFAVRDTGIGIALDQQAHIFTGFSQAEASTTRRFGGTGLGLAICQRLVALMGGELRVHSTPGLGSVFDFRIRLPFAEAPDAPAASTPPPDLGALRVLLVDDNASAREVLAGMAQSLGWQADVAASGAQAVALAAACAAEGRPYETVFIDWQMPTMDGWETSRRLLALPQTATAAAPLLFMITGHGREALAERTVEEQAALSAFLVKPVTASMLFDAVADARLALAHPEFANRSSPRAPVRRLAGLRLLVVEDNPNNRQVAQELLSEEGAQVALADNGRLGVEAVAAADPPFDAVLMDLQMPVMDGYTATARIRQHLRQTALPIIAMTANAMGSDREACLAAGMNDHVGKPFDLSNLVATLLRHTGRRTAATPSAAPPDGTIPPEVLQDAQRRGIELGAALGRMGGNNGVYLRMLRSFIKDLAALPRQLASLLQEGRFDESRRLMHTVKGLAGTLGVRPLARIAAEAERSLGADEPSAQQDALIERMSTLVAATLQDVQHVADALHRWSVAAPGRARGGAGELPGQRTGGLAGLPSLHQALDELADLLRRADMRALDVFEQLQQTHAVQTQGGVLEALEQAMAALDFDQALAECQRLKTRLRE